MSKTTFLIGLAFLSTFVIQIEGFFMYHHVLRGPKPTQNPVVEQPQPKSTHMVKFKFSF